jgi:hypothetical protein
MWNIRRMSMVAVALLASGCANIEHYAVCTGSNALTR